MVNGPALGHFFLVIFHRTFGVEDSIHITYHKYSAAVFLLKFTYVKCFCKRLTTPNMDHMLKIQHDLHPTGSTNEISPVWSVSAGHGLAGWLRVSVPSFFSFWKRYFWESIILRAMKVINK